MNGRLKHLDLIKAIAIYLVLTYHSTLYYIDFNDFTLTVNYCRFFLNALLSCGVPLFFLVNGYLLFRQEFVLKKHLLKIVKLIVLSFIWQMILMPIYLLIAGEEITFRKVVSGIVNMDPNWYMNFFWFIGALVCIYIVFPALKALYDKNFKAFAVLTFIITFFSFGPVLLEELCAAVNFAFKAGIDFSAISDLPVFSMFNPVKGIHGWAFVYFCGGGFLLRYEDRIKAVRPARRNALAVICLIIFAALLAVAGVVYSKNVFGQYWDLVWNGYDTVFTLVNTFCIYILCLNYRADSGFITQISRNTLGIYLTHGLILRLTKPYLMTLGVVRNIPCNLVYSFMVLCIALGLCLLLRKIPIVRKLIW